MVRVRATYNISERRSCRLLGVTRSTCRYQSVADERAFLRIRLRDLATSRPRFGYRRLHILLRREGWLVNAKLVYRLYREEGLGIQRRVPRRRKSCQIRAKKPLVSHCNQTWSMDFMADQLDNGQRIRVLTLVDNLSRESLAIRVGQRFTGDDVVRVMEDVVSTRGAPESIQVDNGPEFISKSLDWWAYWNKVQLDFSRPGTPTDNAFIESFNGRLRQECLNQHWFLSLADAQSILDAWRTDYNETRPHSSLENQTPSQFARRNSLGSSSTKGVRPIPPCAVARPQGGTQAEATAKAKGAREEP